jgi:hypothetical protein
MGILKTPYTIVAHFTEGRKQKENTKNIIASFVIKILDYLEFTRVIKKKLVLY